ncbi:hypothetical protein GGR52DRAFT_4071 [Hypoxylon sp. FL1284]|nr:hypothetical protein GGR52DRAFT_4071 [Hypoxylon sp. FL1284]
MRFLALAVLAPELVAAGDELYQIHQLKKNQNLLRHPKREPSCQQPGYSLCPASVDGGCCPNGYACAVSSCYATTAGPTTACGLAGYYNCPIAAGAANCCPVGYICGDRGCDPPAEATGYTATCPTSYFGCPSSFGYGCCPNGMQCGSQTCYNTTPQTLPVSGTVTTTNANGDTITTVVTSTVVITPGGPDASATSSASRLAGVPKLVPSTVSKLPAVETGSSSSSSSSSGGGLTGSQLGGIVGGAIALLLIMVAIAAIILWRLKRTEKAVRSAEDARRHETTYGGPPQSQKSGFDGPSVSEVDGTDAESVARARAAAAAHYRARSPSFNNTTAPQSRSETPNYYGSNASATPPAWPGPAYAAPPSDASDGGRQSSLDSHAAAAAVARPSVESVSLGGGHSRQPSDVSELEAGDGGSGRDGAVAAELETRDAASAAPRRSGSASRKGAARPADGAAAPLGTLDELTELHGHYGPADIAVGQTAARLRATNSSIGSGEGSNPS